MNKITDKHFNCLWQEALDYHGEKAAWVSDAALGWETHTDDPYAEPLDVGAPEFQERLDYLSRLWDVAHLSVKDICKASGLTQVALAQHFCIPRRTVEDWCRGVAKCADYIRLMMAEALGLFRR